VVPVVEASFNWGPVLPVNDSLERDRIVHVAGASIVVCVVDCRLGSVVPSGLTM